MMRPTVTTALAALVCGCGRAVQAPVGTWQLLSRTDSSAVGVQPADGPLGADPIAWIIYDSRGHVAAQLMARDRTTAASSTPPALPPDLNNSSASGGYDAYFGTYEVDAEQHTISHHLLAAASPGDVGRTLKRTFLIRGDTLLIAFDARRVDGAPVTRRVVWHRIAP